MRKLNFVWLMILVLLMGACESEVEKDAAAAISAGLADGGVAILPLSQEPETRAGGTIRPLWAAGEKVGLYLRTQGLNTGPLEYTIKSTAGGISFVEPVVVNNPLREHTYYAYHPFHVNKSTDPTRVDATPVPANQVQAGASDAHKATYEYNIAEPAKIYPANEQLRLYFATTYTFFQFQISAEMNGVNVTSIELQAPSGKLINFTSAKTDITKYRTDAAFAQLFDLAGGSSKTTLSISSGGLNIPNSTTSYAAAYIVSVPFDCTNQKLNIKVTTSDKKTYTFEHPGVKYNYGQEYIIPLRITQGTVKPTPKNIRVLSLCGATSCCSSGTAGSLGCYDNTKQWNNYYGARDIHGREARRLLYEHFGKGKTVETGVISFEMVDNYRGLNCVTDAYLDKFDIIFLNEGSRPTRQTAQKIMNWLKKSDKRVLMLAYDWKDQCITPYQSDAQILCRPSTNYLIFRDHIRGVEPHWYNVTGCWARPNYNIGNWGSPRSNILVPFETNDRTSYFWETGPFKTGMKKTGDYRYWIQDCWFGSACVTDPNVIPIITYRNALNANNQYCAPSSGKGDNGMILGVDPTKRIVYIGDSEIFSTECVQSHTQHAKMARSGHNIPSKVMGNLWAWMVNIVQQP